MTEKSPGDNLRERGTQQELLSTEQLLSTIHTNFSFSFDDLVVTGQWLNVRTHLGWESKSKPSPSLVGTIKRLAY
jgi:hypothetical protein